MPASLGHLFEPNPYFSENPLLKKVEALYTSKVGKKSYRQYYLEFLG